MSFAELQIITKRLSLQEKVQLIKMLADDIAGRPYSKAEHNRLLQAVIDRI